MSEIPRQGTSIQRTGGPINHAMHRSGCIVRERRIKDSAFSDSAIRRLAAHEGRYAGPRRLNA